MCLQPLYRLTSAKYINTSKLGQSLRVQYNCGKCAECEKAKQNEYIYRCDSLYNATSQRGGFTYWDTFTYAPNFVPLYTPKLGLCRGMRTIDGVLTTCIDKQIHYDKHTGQPYLSKSRIDITNEPYLLCFNRSDYVKFFKRLRINISRDFPVDSNGNFMLNDKGIPQNYQLYRINPNGSKESNLKYFFVSEYGESDNYSHRSHYHCLFFVQIPHMTPEVFYSHLKRAWQFGRLDEDKPVSAKIINGQGAIHYVAKYVNKSSDYTNKVKSFINSYVQVKQGVEVDYKGIIEDELKDFMPFHRHSKGFGLDILSQQDYDFMLKSGKMLYEDSKGKHAVDIPLYIKRKMWYTLEKSPDGSSHWLLNNEGKIAIRNAIDLQINRMAERFESYYDALLSIYNNQHNKVQRYINSLLNGRTWLDFAIYIRLYKGKINPHYNKDFPDVDTMIESMLDYDIDFDSLFLLDPDSFKDYLPINKLTYYFSRQDGFYHNIGTDRLLSFNDFAEMYSINQHSFDCFEYFDTLFNVLMLSAKYKAVNVQSSYELQKQVTKRINNLLNW